MKIAKAYATPSSIIKSNYSIKFSDMKTIIEKDAALLTLINVITVEPEKQSELLKLLVEATNKVFNKLPGFVSANFHSSLDGTKIVNYAQWKSEGDFKNMQQHEEAKVYMGKATKLAIKLEPAFYTVEHVNHI
jgi:heme-degrading monooxygenase HmoA